MSYRIPSSFCTMCTINCSQELVGLLLSLSLHHTGAKTYIICDTKTKEKIMSMTPQPKLDIYWKTTLDKYTMYNRNQMEQMKIWSDFQMAKAEVIEFALENTNDTLFLDSDILILDKLYIESNDNDVQLGVSPQFVNDDIVKKTGYYNGGVLWTNQKSLPENWKKFTKTSRYYDQASIEDLTKIYNYFEFKDNYNLQTWRFIVGKEKGEQIASYLSVRNGKIFYKDSHLKFIHTHFNYNRFAAINNLFINKMTEAGLYREISIAYRIIHDKWIIQIPKQPMSGIWSHKNDSYRELAILLKAKNRDVDIELNKSVHCWLKPTILMYDRPTLLWINQEISKATMILLGNGDINVEGKQLNQFKKHIKPWIFWPRRPIILEKVLKDNGVLSWDDRKNTTVFIGNSENSVQEKFRFTNSKWEDVIDCYHNTKGNKHKFTQNDYLMELRKSRFGLCLRGYGSKCHREVELMAFGTVPIVTKEVSINSYYDPPVENIHYILVESPEQLKEKVSSITQDKWEEMSKACYDWYQKNVHSDNCWNNMIHNILYNV